MKDQKIQTIVKTALMMAIIYIFTSTFKVPETITGGYIHLGDCMIFLAVILLGRKNGTIAAAFGGALADLLGGYVIWVLPTFLIKGIMAFIMGTFIEKILPEKNGNWLIGSICGGIFQIFGYALASSIMVGIGPALAAVLGNVVQTACGVIFAAVIITALQKSHVLKRLQNI